MSRLNLAGAKDKIRRPEIRWSLMIEDRGVLWIFAGGTALQFQNVK